MSSWSLFRVLIKREVEEDSTRKEVGHLTARSVGVK